VNINDILTVLGEYNVLFIIFHRCNHKWITFFRNDMLVICNIIAANCPDAPFVVRVIYVLWLYLNLIGK